MVLGLPRRPKGEANGLWKDQLFRRFPLRNPFGHFA